MFKIGDVVEITVESDATGMLDFKKGEGYAVCDYRVAQAGTHTAQVYVYTESGKGDWYHCTHFKLKEDTIVEKKECLFKEGQTVYCSVFGKGVISSVSLIDDEIHVEFSVITSFNYDVNGIIYGGTSRSLFFSPPVVTGATEPLFEPTLKSGDVVIISCFKDRSDTSRFKIGVVEDENEEFIYTEGDNPWDKGGRDFYRLGEKINFK